MKKLPMLTVYWSNGRVRLIDQTKLPLEEKWLELSNYQQVAKAIKTMQVRGAPAIGVTAALGLALVAHNSKSDTTIALLDELKKAASELLSTRPTAVNLSWAVNKMLKKAELLLSQPVDFARSKLIEEAIAIQKQDIDCNLSLGKHGASLISNSSNILTHCNAGSLACAGGGTALGVIQSAWQQGKRVHVFVDETRPLLQGARLTAWELKRAGIPITLIADNMAGYFMQKGKVDLVIVGADRIAANGDTANKIGTYSVACLAKLHSIPFFVAAPTSTIDSSLSSGDDIPIEERSTEEVTTVFGRRIAPPGIEVANPAFDLTPAELIKAIITEKGVIYPPFANSISQLLESCD